MLIICHYSEIGIKGKNRDFFEKKLSCNIKESFKKNAHGLLKKTQIIPGRILIELNETGLQEKIYYDKSKHILKNIFGIANFSFAQRAEQNLEDIKKKMFRNYYKI